MKVSEEPGAVGVSMDGSIGRGPGAGCDPLVICRCTTVHVCESPDAAGQASRVGGVTTRIMTLRRGRT